MYSNGLAPNIQPTITRTNADLRRHVVSPGHSELILFLNEDIIC